PGPTTTKVSGRSRTRSPVTGPLDVDSGSFRKPRSTRRSEKRSSEQSELLRITEARKEDQLVAAGIGELGRNATEVGGIDQGTRCHHLGEVAEEFVVVQ